MAHIDYTKDYIKHYVLTCVILSCIQFVSAGEWNLISQTRTTFLEVYRNYIDAVLMHFDVPDDSVEAKFEFRGSYSASMFHCPIQDVTLFLQYGAPPVINPDHSEFPSDFLLDRREKMYNITFRTDKNQSFINLALPLSGSYYALAFHPYVNPKDQGITQDGLFPICNSFVDASLSVRQLNSTMLVEEQTFHSNLKPNETKLFKIYIPTNAFKMILVFNNVNFCAKCTEFEVSVYPSMSSSGVQNITVNASNLTPSFRVLGDDDYYIKIASNVTNDVLDAESNLDLNVKLVEAPYTDDEVNAKLKQASEDEKFFMNASHMYYTSPSAAIAWKYEEFQLHKSINTESFQYTYELDAQHDGSIPININVTNIGFAALKFNVRDVLDVGGTLNIALAFVPKLQKEGRWIYIKEEPKNHTVVACLRRAGIEVPVWENKCRYFDVDTASPLILNSTVKNATFMIPYPEPGNWYLTFRLFCGECKPCDCPKSCTMALDQCITTCEGQCLENCFECQKKCERKMISKKTECQGCDCDGNCRKEYMDEEKVGSNKAPKAKCNSSILFDVSSYPCVGNKCGPNGKCAFGVAEGFVYSTCVCYNNYKGWDCSDSSNANSLFEIWLELLLLVFSNFAFGIAVYVAYVRKYYVEALVYASILFSSTFYHACDAGENRINFCLLALNVLQFCDFYCAILSIWVTMIAMAYLPQPMPHLLHIFGAIFLGGAVTLDKTSLWVFVIPVTIGFVIVLGSWARRNYRIYKTKETSPVKMFPSKRYLTLYLPSGLIIALIALLAFALFQTQSNYKYVHSLWHIMMAIAVVILLPKMEVFLPKANNINGNHS